LGIVPTRVRVALVPPGLVLIEAATEVVFRQPY